MQTVSENGVDASEVLSELKSNRQVIDESLVKDNKMDVTEVQKDGPMQESGMESELSAPKAASDANMDSEVMDESSEESSADDKGKFNWSLFAILSQMLKQFFNLFLLH